MLALVENGVDADPSATSPAVGLQRKCPTNQSRLLAGVHQQQHSPTHTTGQRMQPSSRRCHCDCESKEAIHSGSLVSRFSLSSGGSKPLAAFGSTQTCQTLFSTRLPAAACLTCSMKKHPSCTLCTSQIMSSLL